jgi:hypothetical protein
VQTSIWQLGAFVQQVPPGCWFHAMITGQTKICGGEFGEKSRMRTKKMQMTLFRGATALLYLGPLFAGLAGFGWGLVPGFLAIFLLYLFVIRRSVFPRRAADWTDRDLMLRLLTQGLVQLLLIVLCFAIGRGLGGVIGAVVPFSPFWTLALSFVAVPLCRWLAIQPMPLPDDAPSQG